MARGREAQPILLRLLGAFEARLPSGAPLIIQGRKAQALLAYLAVPAGRRVGRDTLAALLWGDADEAAARNSLRQMLFSIRRALGEAAADTLVVDGDAVALGTAVRVDVGEFERTIAAKSPEALAGAIDLYRGELVEGLSVEEPTFEEWVTAERDRLRGLLRGGLTRLVANHAKTGNTVAAIELAHRLLTLDPLDEAAHRMLMRLYAEQGRVAGALRQYQVCLEVLRRELGVEPDEETRALYRRLLGRRGIGRRDAPLSSTLPSAGTPLIGREAELARLDEALDAAWRAEGQVVAVLGEAGIGKSRLIGELAAHAERRGGRVIVGACHEAERTLPLHPWADVVRRGGVLEVGQHPKSLPRAWRLELARLFPELEPDAAPGAPQEESALTLFEALAHLLLGLALDRPLVLLLEDLHWSDVMSVRFLSFLARRVGRAQVLIVCTAREEEAVDAPVLTALLLQLDREGRLRRLVLAPLAREDTDGLVRTLVSTGTDAVLLATLGESVWAASEGNPFVAVETVQAWRDGAVTGVSFALPRKVQELIAARLDRLGTQGQEMTATAAVIADEFDFTLLARATGLTEAAAAETLEELVRRRVLHGVGERFAFVHERIRGVAYQRVLSPRRKLLHRRVAEAAEALYADDLEPHAAALGFHFRAAEEWGRAAEYLRRAGVLAFARGGHREAAASFEQAIAALDRLPGTDDTRLRGIDLRFDLRHALLPLAEFEKVGSHLHDAERLATEMNDRARLGRVTAFLGNYYWWMSEHERAGEYCRRALAIARETDDVALQASAAMYLGLVHYTIGELTEGAAVFRAILAASRDGVARERLGLIGLTAVYAGCYLCMCLAELGEFEEGYPIAETTVKLATDLRHPFALAHARIGGCSLAARRGDFDRVQALETWYRDVQDPSAEVWPLADWWILYAQVQAGDFARALPQLEAATELVTTPSALVARPMVSRPVVTAWLAEAYLHAGRHKDAAFMTAQALDLARAQGERGNEVWALRLLGEVAARAASPDVGDAEVSYGLALTLARERGMRPAQAHCRLGLGRLHACTRRVAQARRELTAAVALLKALGMTRWLPEAEAALTRLGPPADPA